ncbi:helix-turn-helix domain-containing protein [Lachnotalea glycerini]|nr:AraC family transcriptional regulator [Lachnotalea glycerini]
MTRTQIYNYKKMHNINGKDLIVPYIDIDTMLNIMAISNTMINGTIISEEEIISYSIKTAKHFKPDEEDDLKYKLEKMEADLNHISYAEERMFTDAVKNADLEMIDKIKNSIESERMGRLATASRKQNEYVTVCIITLITRAAIEGGMSPSEAYNLSDLYLQKLEKCTNIVEMLYLQKNALDDFVRFVKISRDQQKSSDFIELCKDYIGKNIFQTIKVENIAREVGLNPSYVSRKFSEQVGMTIQNYILRERVQLAKNMLKYSESDIVEISEYLCFCSQSHFGSVFRKYTGQTPSEYRKENKIREFIP